MARRSITVGTRTTLDVALPSVSPLDVSVHDARTGAPIADASILVMDTSADDDALLPEFGLMAREPDVWSPAEASSRTGSNGLARLSPAATGARRSVFAAAPGFAPRRHVVDAGEDRCLLLLEPAISVTVEVVDSANSPVSGATVVSLGSDGQSLLPGDLVPRTGEDGRCVIYVGDPASPHDTPAGLFWSEREEALSLDELMAKDRAETAAKAKNKPTAYVLPEGVLSEVRLFPRTAMLLVRAPGHGGAFLGKTFLDAEVVRVILPPAREGGVRLIGPDSLPRGGVPVRIVPQLWGASRDGSRRGPRSAFSEESGFVTVPGVVDWAPYLVVAGSTSGDSVVLAALSGGVLPQFPKVRVPAFHSLTVEVQTPRGTAAADCAVVALGADTGSALPHDGFDLGLRTGADGTAALHLFEGHIAGVAAFHGPTVWGWAVPTESSVDPLEPVPLPIPLRAPGRLAVELRDAQGAPVPGVTVLIRPAPTGPVSGSMHLWMAAEGVTGRDGFCRFEVASGMTWDIQIAAGISRLLKTVEVDSRTETSVQFTQEARRERVISVRVDDEMGTAVPYAIVSMFVPREEYVETEVADVVGVARMHLPPTSPDAPVTFRVAGTVLAEVSIKAERLADSYRVSGRSPATSSFSFEIDSHFLDWPGEPTPTIEWSIVDLERRSWDSTSSPPLRTLAWGRASNGPHSTTVRALNTPTLRLRPEHSPPWYPRVSLARSGSKVKARLRAVRVTADAAVVGRTTLAFAIHEGRQFRELWSLPGLLAGSSTTIYLDDEAMGNDDYRILPGGARTQKEGRDAMITVPSDANRIHLGPEDGRVHCSKEKPSSKPTKSNR
jgi:hypothetical protein